MNTAWKCAEPDIPSILGQFRLPLESLAAADVPALVIRRVFPKEDCRALVTQLVAEQLLYDPALPVPQRFQDDSIPEGFFREGRNSNESSAWDAGTANGRRRIDIGTSLGYRGSEQSDFFAHSKQTHELFSRLFDGRPNPVQVLYESLEKLSVNKRVVTAHEADGRQYGPAIIRAHYGGYTYAPHFDSVRLREKRADYAVHEFEHQFAGVLVLQNTSIGDKTAQCVLHRCLWQPELNSCLQNQTFHDYAARQNVENVQVVLEPGDLYFFNTRCIHEVPGVAGSLPRIVLATFIGYSNDRDDIFVWS